MVTITNGKDVFTVTNGAFSAIYKKQGFTIYDPSKKTKKNVETASEMTDDEFVELLEEKPLNKWNKTEIKRYAEVFGIDISGTKSISEARDIIRQFRSYEEDAE